MKARLLFLILFWVPAIPASACGDQYPYFQMAYFYEKTSVGVPESGVDGQGGSSSGGSSRPGRDLVSPPKLPDAIAKPETEKSLTTKPPLPGATTDPRTPSKELNTHPMPGDISAAAKPVPKPGDTGLNLFNPQYALFYCEMRCRCYCSGLASCGNAPSDWKCELKEGDAAATAHFEKNFDKDTLAPKPGARVKVKMLADGAHKCASANDHCKWNPNSPACGGEIHPQ